MKSGDHQMRLVVFPIIYRVSYMGVEPKIGVGTPSPKWDGLFHGKPYFLMEDSGGPPLFWGNTLNECMKHM